jgi:hypothetical protein
MQQYNSYTPTDRETDFVSKLLNIQPNDISYLFFSENNINYINLQLIENIKKITQERYGQKIQIEPQKKHLIITIMRHVYFKNIKNIYRAEEEVDILNNEVLRQMIPVVISELIAYMRYIRDYNRIIPLDLPKSDNRKQGGMPSFYKMFTASH